MLRVLTILVACAKHGAAMKKPLLPFVAAIALLPLAACNSQPKAETVDTRAPDPMASALANAPAVELPPAIKATVSFRCQPGNALVFVDFFQGDKMVNFRDTKTAMPKQLKAEEAGKPFTNADGVKVTGTPKSVTVEQPGKGTLTCKA